MSDLLMRYAEVAGERVVDQLRQLAEPLAGKSLVHVNSTRQGGGVAEILEKLVPLTRELGIDATWEVIEGDDDFFRCTKGMHNGLQGDAVALSPQLLDAYEETNRANSERLRNTLAPADVVFVHDPQPAPQLELTPEREGIWLWRCHIDLSRPDRGIWRYLRDFVEPYDASIFSLADYARRLPHDQFLIPPSIDPLSDKNKELEAGRVAAVAEEHGLDPERPVAVQVSRYDRFKDPVGVIRAYQLCRRFHPELQLVLAGGDATDDPEGAEVLEEVRAAAGDDPDVHVLLLPSDAHETINALQRLADIVLQKSTREGFGLTVTEGMWKGRAVIGGRVGGIRLQIADGHTGYMVSTPEGAAFRMRQLLEEPERRREMGRRAREFVRDNFLLTRLLREHLTAVHSVMHGGRERIDLFDGA